MTEIPTTPQNDPAETIKAALAHGLTGHPEKAAALYDMAVAALNEMTGGTR